MTRFSLLAATAIGLVATLAQSAMAQCPSGRAVAGTIVHATGPQTMMTIYRAGQPVLPVEFASVCEGDIVDLESPRAIVKMRMNDSPLPSTLIGKTRTTIAPRSKPPTVADNAFAVMLDRLMPDLARFAKHANARTTRSEAFWNAPGLTEGTALLVAGERGLVLGWTAPVGTYRLEIRDTQTGAVTATGTTGGDVILPPRAWNVGDFRVSLYSVDGPAAPLLTGAFRVVAAPPPPAPAAPAWAGPELAAAAHALTLIDSDPARYGLEALQIMHQAPQEGLDRTAIFDAIRGAEAS